MIQRGLVIAFLMAGLLVGTLAAGRLLPSAGQVAFASEYLGSTDIYLADLSRNVEFHISPGGLPLWSPDGRYLAYVAGTRANQNIYVMDANGGKLRNLTNDSPHDMGPTWSPDGRRLAFESNRDGNWEIYVVDTCDGCSPNPRNLTHDPHLDMSASWSPDGRQIAFLSNRDGRSEIYVMDTDGTHVRRLTQNSHTDLQPPRWSPDSRSLAFVSLRAGNWDVFVMDVACGDLPDSCEGELHNTSMHVEQDSEPVWSPDGQWIAFTSRRDGNFEIYVASVEGGEARNLSQHPDQDSAPVWSLDGSQIAFQSNRDREYSDDLYAVDVVSGVSRRLTYHYGSNQYAAWWPR